MEKLNESQFAEQILQGWVDLYASGNPLPIDIQQFLQNAYSFYIMTEEEKRHQEKEKQELIKHLDQLSK